MELRRLSICIAFFLLAVAKCSDGHAVDYSSEKDLGSSEDVNFGEAPLGDEPLEDETQNDADGGDGDDEDKEIPAVILNKPENYAVTVGSNIRLECKTDGGHAVLQWTKGETKIYIGAYRVIKNDRIPITPDSGDLVIRDLKFEDSGEYTCTILQKKPVSVTHKVVVGEPPKIIAFKATKNGVVSEGTDVEMVCNVTGTPQPKILWSRTRQLENERLTEKDASFIDNRIIIKNITPEMSGKYYCYALNSIGNNQAEHKIVVHGKPNVHVHRTVVNSAINVEAVLECMVHDNNSSPHFRWYKNDRLIEDTTTNYSISTVETRSNLTIIPRSDAEFGNFTCEAENNHGVRSKSIELVQRPIIEDVSMDGSQLSFRVHSHQPLEEIELQLRSVNGQNEWAVLSVPFSKSRNHEDILYELQDKVDPGKYEAIIKVKNSKSWSDPKETYLEIETQPMSIQTASILGRGNSAHSIRPILPALSTVLMYLLVRMF